MTDYFKPRAGVEYTISPEYAAPAQAKPDKFSGKDQWGWGITIISEQTTVGGKTKKTDINKRMYWYFKQKVYDMVITANLKSGCLFFLNVLPESMEKEGKTINFNAYCITYENKAYYSHTTSAEANVDKPPPPASDYAEPPGAPTPEELAPHPAEETPQQTTDAVEQQQPPENEIVVKRAALLSQCLDEAKHMTEKYDVNMEMGAVVGETQKYFTSEDVRSLAISLFIQVCSEQYEKLGFKR